MRSRNSWKKLFKLISIYALMSSFIHSQEWTTFKLDVSHTGRQRGHGNLVGYEDFYWIFRTGGEVRGTPVIADLENDGRIEVIFGSMDHNLYVLNGLDGTLKWRFTSSDVIRSTPTVYDINGDGKKEIFFTSKGAIYALNYRGSLMWVTNVVSGVPISSPTLFQRDGSYYLLAVGGPNLYCLNVLDGTLKWVKNFPDIIYSTPAVGDINGDEEPDIVIGCNNGDLYALSSVNGTEEWRVSFASGEYGTSGSALLYDVDGDSIDEVFVGTEAQGFYALEGKDGSVIWHIPALGYIYSTPSIVYSDSDTLPEIVLTCGWGDSRVIVANIENGSIIWETTLTEGNPGKPSPAVADIDGDSRDEIIVPAEGLDRVFVFNAENGDLLWKTDNIYVWWTFASPSVGDINGDGFLDIVINSDDYNVYAISRYTPIRVLIYPDQEDSILPGQSIDYNFVVENKTLLNRIIDIDAFNSDTFFIIELLDSLGASHLYDSNGDGHVDIGVVDSEGIKNFILRVYAPEDALYGRRDTVILRAFCADDTTIYDTAFAVTVVQKYVAIDVSPDTLDSLEAAASILISLRGTNLGNVTDVMDITASQTNFRWQFSLYDSTGLNLLQDTDGDGVSDLGVQLPLVSKSFYLLIRSPSTAVPQEVDTIIVKGHSSQDPNVVDSAIIVLKIKGPKIIEVEPDTSGFIYPGDSVDYKLRCWNYDSLDHLIEVKKGLGIFNVEFLDTLLNPLPDADGDGYPEIGPVIPQTFKTFVVRVLCPSTQTPGSVDTMLIHGFSNSDTTLGDYATVITTVRNPYGVELYPDAVDSCGPGEEVIYSVHVRNTGVREDTIEIYPVSQHSGFTCVISGPQDMDSDGRQEVYLNPGEDFIFQVRVYAADSVFPGVSDTLRIYGHSQLSPTTGDYVTLITTIIPRNISIDIYPDRYVSTPPGGTMDVFFTVETRGSIQDLIEFPVSGGGPEWFVTIEDSSGIPLQDSDNNGIVEIGPVAGGENVKIRVKVTAPDRYDSTRYCITARFHTFPYIKDSASLLVEVIPPLDFHNSPNPFRKKTTFILSVPDEGRLFLAIYTRTGERIEVIFDGKVDRGITKVEWEPKKLKPGTYPVLFRYESNGETRKMIKKLVKLP
ncbi:MAG: hypothetical protein DRQ03_06590 [Candidatus Hydrothermota bacterium]|nr:MAG: hypothetical protein DRQ03_06590 [Candidatus Hydrothermae bacterium]